MAAPDWLALRVVINDRAAIFAEYFPAAFTGLEPDVVERFGHEDAQNLLYTFAGAWPVLGRDAGDPATRFVYVSIADQVCRFRGVELAPGAIVVDDVVGSRFR